MSDRLLEQVMQLAKAVENLERRMSALEASIRSLGTSGGSVTAKVEHDARKACGCSGCTRRRQQAEQRRLRVL